MRIFVMFGTQDKRFDRLLNAILDSKFVNENDVYVQLGDTKGTYDKIHFLFSMFTAAFFLFY